MPRLTRPSSLDVRIHHPFMITLVAPDARSGRARATATGGILSAVLSFTPPMLASSGRPTGALDDWVVEPKADGWRAQVAGDG